MSVEELNSKQEEEKISNKAVNRITEESWLNSELDYFENNYPMRSRRNAVYKSQNKLDQNLESNNVVLNKSEKNKIPINSSPKLLAIESVK